MEARNVLDPIIPSVINGIWLGDIPSQEVLDNLANWKKINPSYTVRLWIDSSTYNPDDGTVATHFTSMLLFAKHHKIMICDISPLNETYFSGITKFPDLYSQMLSRHYYDDELNGKDNNLAAASDLLRVEIMYQLGGIYIDPNDVLPGNPLPEKLFAKHGFLFHQLNAAHENKEAQVGNDILASIPKEYLITELRYKIHQNYKEAYKNISHLKAHRSAIFTSPLIYNGDNSRRKSTLKISGPFPLIDIIKICALEINLETKNELNFPSAYYNTPANGSDLTWFDPDADSKYEIVTPILRNYFREYFNEEIKLHLETLAIILQKEEGNNTGILRLNSKIQHYKNIMERLNALKLLLNALPLETSAPIVYDSIVKQLNEETLNLIDKHGGHIIYRLCKSCHTLEQLIKYCETTIPAKQISDLLLSLSKQDDNLLWKVFIKIVIDTTDGKVNMDAFNDMLARSQPHLSLSNRF